MHAFYTIEASMYVIYVAMLHVLWNILAHWSPHHRFSEPCFDKICRCRVLGTCGEEQMGQNYAP